MENNNLEQQPGKDEAAARAYFPRGLVQPRDSFRFSEDALLLAAFVARHCLPLPQVPAAMADLGCGCGVVGLACLLAHPGLTVHGLDCVPELVAAALDNAALLGLRDRFTADRVNLADPEERKRLPEGRHAVVAANPPYRPLGTGRLPPSVIRQKALFADDNTLPGFVLSAKRLLARGGSFALIYPWETREHLFGELANHGFAVQTVLPVHAREGEPLRCLARAGIGAMGSEPHVEAPLVLRGAGTRKYSAGAVSFCPWLAAGAEWLMAAAKV